jgi:hypothetical protein
MRLEGSDHQDNDVLSISALALRDVRLLANH